MRTSIRKESHLLSAGPEHALGVNPGVELRSADAADGQRGLAEARPSVARMRGDQTCTLLADVRRQCGDEHQRLAQHRATGLVGRQPQLPESCSRTAAHEAKIIGNFVERHGDGSERAMQADQRLVSGQRGEEVSGHHKGFVQAFGEQRGDPGAKCRMRIQPRPDGGAADGEGMHGGQCAVQCVFGNRKLGVVAAELLAERERCGVLQMGAADLDDMTALSTETDSADRRRSTLF